MSHRNFAGYLLLLAICLSVTACGVSPDVLWRFRTGSQLRHTPAISQNKLIIGGEDHFLYAVDLNTGKEIWKTNLGDMVLVTPFPDRDRIYTGTASGDFYAVNAANGEPVWKFHAEKMLQFDPCADSEGIYFGGFDGKFYKINRDGKLIWQMQTGFQITSSCVIYKDLVLTSSWDYNVYAVRRQSGETVWKHPTGEYAYAGPIIVGDSAYYSSHQRLYRFDAASGKLQFEITIPYSQNVVSHDNAIYTSENGLTMRSLDGKLLKNAPFKPFPNFTPTVVPPYVIASSTNHELFGFDVNTLQQKWKFKVDDNFWSEGVEHNGVYYVGNANGYVYALKLPS